MIVNHEEGTLEMEARDWKYFMPAYVTQYLFYMKNELPKAIVFPMFMTVPHPDPVQAKAGVTIPVEWVAEMSPKAMAIQEDGGNVPEATPEQVAEADLRDEIYTEATENTREEPAREAPEVEDKPGLSAYQDVPEDRLPKMPNRPAEGPLDDTAPSSAERKADLKKVRDDLKPQKPID